MADLDPIKLLVTDHTITKSSPAVLVGHGEIVYIPELELLLRMEHKVTIPETTCPTCPINAIPHFCNKIRTGGGSYCRLTTVSISEQRGVLVLVPKGKLSIDIKFETLYNFPNRSKFNNLALR